jgi:hypothetical protein
VKRYLLNLLIWLDIGLNVLVFAGSPYETISSRVGKRRDKGEHWACVFCRVLDWLDPQHCDTARVDDYGKAAANWWKWEGIMFRYRAFVVFDILATLVACFLVNWWAPLFAELGPITSAGTTRYGFRLPEWLAWFDTFDDDLDSGARRDGKAHSYWQRVAWLNRNPAYGFSYWVLGIPFNPSDWEVVNCDGSPSVEGFDFRAICNSDSQFFNEHSIKNGWRIKCGWKAWNMYEMVTGTWRTVPWGPELRIPFVFSITRA